MMVAIKNELPEHARVELPRLAEFDAAIDELLTRQRELELERQELIDAEARKIAKFAVGYEFIYREKRRRITKIKGDYYDYRDLGSDSPIIWVRYRGVTLFKNGNVGNEETIYPT